MSLFVKLTMFGKRYLLQGLAIACYLASCTNANDPASITRVSVLLDLNIDDVKSHYHIGLLSFAYDTDDLKKRQSGDSNSVELLITNARLLVLQGKTRFPSRPKYDIGPKGVLFLLEAKGIGQLSPDGNGVKNCQFLFAESMNLEDNPVEEAVKEILFKVLPSQLSQELCNNINEYHFNKINSLD